MGFQPVHIHIDELCGGPVCSPWVGVGVTDAGLPASAVARCWDLFYG